MCVFFSLCNFIFRLSIECRQFCADSRCQGSLRDHYDIYWAFMRTIVHTHVHHLHSASKQQRIFIMCCERWTLSTRARHVCPLRKKKQRKKNCWKRSKRVRRDKRHTYQCADWANTLNSHWAKARAKFYRYTTSHISNKHSREKIPTFFARSFRKYSTKLSRNTRTNWIFVFSVFFFFVLIYVYIKKCLVRATKMILQRIGELKCTQKM